MNDLINRELLRFNLKRRLMETAMNNVGYQVNMDECIVDIVEDRLDVWIDEIPKTEKSEAEWKPTKEVNSGHWVHRCSECGWEQEYPTKFCPDCGRRMEYDNS